MARQFDTDSCKAFYECDTYTLYNHELNKNHT